MVRIDITMKGTNTWHHRRGDVWEGNAYFGGKLSAGMPAGLESFRLFNFFWSVEKHDTNPANSGMIGLLESVKSVFICG